MRALSFLLMMMCFSAYADTHFHPLFADSAVVQRDSPVPVIVFSDEADMLTLRLDDAIAGNARVENGRWSVTLPPQPAGGPHTLSVTGDNINLTISDIYFGDVYLASGQSNMELTMARVEEAYPEDVTSAHYPQIREYTVPDRFGFKQPLSEPGSANWTPAQPETVASLSAVAYYFARHLYRFEGIPIGIINASLGGSPVEAWMPAQRLQSYPQILAEATPFQHSEFITQTQQSDAAASQHWYSRLNTQDAGLHAEPPWHTANADTRDWQTFSVPGSPPFAENGFNGSWWATKTVQLPEVPSAPVILRLGRIRDADEVWINGTRIGNTTYHYPPRRYTVPQGALKQGENVITVRITANAGSTEFFPDKAYFIGNSTQRISLSGDWRYKRAATMPDPAPVQTFIRWKPTGLYNVMIAPLTAYPIKGVLWYQGESNADDPSHYSDKLVSMMDHWRGEWQQPELPFFIVQLANYMARQRAPEESQWAELRNEQSKAAATPDTYLVPTIDAGEHNDIHPVNKRVVGERLAKQAQHAIYHRNVNHSGPALVRSIVQQNKVVLTFEDPEGLHVASNRPAGFTLAGKDGIYHWADITQNRNTLTLFSPQVQSPVSVRYAWANNPLYSVTDAGGWPLAPFEMSVN